MYTSLRIPTKIIETIEESRTVSNKYSIRRKIENRILTLLQPAYRGGDITSEHFEFRKINKSKIEKKVRVVGVHTRRQRGSAVLPSGAKAKLRDKKISLVCGNIHPGNDAAWLALVNR